VQLEHAVTFDAVEYFPAAHAVQVLAPVPIPVFVREPAMQAMQLAWPVLPWYQAAAQGAHAIVEAVLDLPATHAVQLDAPTLASVLVYEPAVHVMQAVWPMLPWYLPAGHVAQAAVDVTLNLPGPQAVHVVAFVVTCPRDPLSQSPLTHWLPALQLMFGAGRPHLQRPDAESRVWLLEGQPCTQPPDWANQWGVEGHGALGRTCVYEPAGQSETPVTAKCPLLTLRIRWPEVSATQANEPSSEIDTAFGAWNLATVDVPSA
jgi:hypothetical protein